MMRIRRLLLFLDRLKGAVLLRVAILFVAVGCACRCSQAFSLYSISSAYSGQYAVCTSDVVCNSQLPCASRGLHIRLHQLDPINQHGSEHVVPGDGGELVHAKRLGGNWRRPGALRCRNPPMQQQNRTNSSARSSAGGTTSAASHIA